MPFRPAVERWRTTAAAVAPGGIPVDLVLAAIELESGGRPGAKSSANAAGLMQVKPSVVEQYNASHKPIPFARMLEKTPDAAADQIRIGSWLLGHHLRMMHGTDPDRAPWPKGPITPWQAKAADLRYSHGGGAFSSLRRGARKAGYPDDPAGWQAYQKAEKPGWTSENPFFHAFAVWKLAIDGGGTRQTARAEWSGKQQPPQSGRQPPKVTKREPTTAKAGGGAGAALLALLALFSFRRTS